MLHRFEAGRVGQLEMSYRTPPTETEEEDFKKTLKTWFEQSSFANQGIHVDQVVVSLPDLSAE